MEQLTISSVYIAGILSFFAPCIFSVIPVYINVLSNGEKGSVIKTILFITGLSTIFVIMGYGFAFISGYFGITLRIISAIIIILLGIYQLGYLNLPSLNKYMVLKIKPIKTKSGYLEAYLLGFTFSLGWTPCVGPILASILLYASSADTATQAGLLMFVYVIGLSTPFLVFTIFSRKLLEKTGWIKRHMKDIKDVTGMLLILMGIRLLYNVIIIFI